EAKELIDSYFASFPTVKNFLESIKEGAKEVGYVETLTRRKRFFDFKNAGARDEAMYLREAVNTVFQGSAADIIKLAMIRIAKKIESENLPVKMILQIHDELIFEADEKEAHGIAKELASIMESVVTLKVPLNTSLNFGKNWGELK
ncbi:MAG TPA: DNA polymerase, partial [Campylobacterales bacterium]|nr:DNA polymerase [Campylobacterales bacterium]